MLILIQEYYDTCVRAVCWSKRWKRNQKYRPRSTPAFLVFWTLIWLRLLITLNNGIAWLWSLFHSASPMEHLLTRSTWENYHPLLLWNLKPCLSGIYYHSIYSSTFSLNGYWFSVPKKRARSPLFHWITLTGIQRRSLLTAGPRTKAVAYFASLGLEKPANLPEPDFLQTVSCTWLIVILLWVVPAWPKSDLNLLLMSEFDDK